MYPWAKFVRKYVLANLMLVFFSTYSIVKWRAPSLLSS